MPDRIFVIRILTAALCSAALLSPAEAGGKPWTLDDILALRDLSEVEISPDGRRVALVVTEADDEENVLNTDLYLVTVFPPSPVATPPQPVRLTRSPKPDHEPRFNPNGTLLAFLSGREIKSPESAGEKPAAKREQVWLIRPDGGEPWCPAPLEGDVHHLAWSPKGATLALLVQEPKPADRTKREKEKDDAVVVDQDLRRDQLWLMDADSGAAVQVTRGALHLTSLDWNPAGDRIAVAGQPSAKVPDGFRSDVYVVDVEKARAALEEAIAQKKLGNAPKQTEPLAMPAPLVTTQGADTDPRWSPDGATIAYLTQDGNDEWYTNTYAAVVPTTGGAPRVLTRAFDERVENLEFAPSGSSLVFQANTRFARRILRVPVSGGDVEVLTKSEDLHRAFALGRDGRLAVFVREGAGAPPELYAAEMPQSGPISGARALTSLNAMAREFDTAVKEPYRWKGADGREIEGHLVKPAASAGKKLPLLVVVHGGPAGVFNNNYSARRGPYPLQLFAQKGFAVLMPNPRGSGGYGESFRKANVRDWGEKDREDILAGVDALVASGVADPDRLGVMGWSYGGFMTSRIITKTHRFKAASVGAGVTNTFSFTGVADIPAFMRSYFGAWPWEDAEVYTSHTALFGMKGVKTPTLIQHGEADARVPISQGWELYVALKEQGVPVEFVTYPRQSHAITEPKLLRDAMRRNVEWFSRWVLGERAGGS